MTAMDIDPTVTPTPEWELTVPRPRKAEQPWWTGTVVPGSARAEQAMLVARIRELEQLVYETRVELTSLRHHIHDVTCRTAGP